MFPQSAGRKVCFNSFSWFVSNVWKPESPPPPPPSPQVYLWVFPQFALVLKERTRRSFSLHFFFLFLVFDRVNDAAGRLPAFRFMTSSSFLLLSWMKLQYQSHSDMNRSCAAETRSECHWWAWAHLTTRCCYTTAQTFLVSRRWKYRNVFCHQLVTSVNTHTHTHSKQKSCGEERIHLKTDLTACKFKMWRHVFALTSSEVYRLPVELQTFRFSLRGIIIKTPLNKWFTRRDRLI